MISKIFVVKIKPLISFLLLCSRVCFVLGFSSTVYFMTYKRVHERERGGGGQGKTKKQIIYKIKFCKEKMEKIYDLTCKQVVLLVRSLVIGLEHSDKIVTYFFVNPDDLYFIIQFTVLPVFYSILFLNIGQHSS